MKRFAPFLWLLIVLRLCVPGALAQQTVSARGAVSVALPMSEAVGVLHSERHIDLLLRSNGGTSMGLDALGDRSASIALCSRELTPEDRAAYPTLQLIEIPIGLQMLAIAVSRDVWMGGVHSLNTLQIRGIYEGKIKNWQQVGGPNLPIKVFMNEPGRGQWEMFVLWLYKELKMAPIWHGAKVKEARETRNMLEFTPGSFALIPPSFVDKQNIFPLAIQEGSADPVEPTLDNVLRGNYPLSRPLLLVVDDKPTGATKVVVDFMTGERGQALVKQFGCVTLDELRAARARK